MSIWSPRPTLPPYRNKFETEEDFFNDLGFDIMLLTANMSCYLWDRECKCTRIVSQERLESVYKVGTKDECIRTIRRP